MKPIISHTVYQYYFDYKFEGLKIILNVFSPGSKIILDLSCVNSPSGKEKVTLLKKLREGFIGLFEMFIERELLRNTFFYTSRKVYCILTPLTCLGSVLSSGQLSQQNFIYF